MCSLKNITVTEGEWQKRDGRRAGAGGGGGGEKEKEKRRNRGRGGTKLAHPLYEGQQSPRWNSDKASSRILGFTFVSSE